MPSIQQTSPIIGGVTLGVHAAPAIVQTSAQTAQQSNTGVISGFQAGQAGENQIYQNLVATETAQKPGVTTPVILSSIKPSVVINPDASPYSSSAGVGGEGVPQGNTPATILSTGLAQTMGVPVGTVVPSGTVVTPAASAGSGGVTTIVTPPVGKSPQTVTTVTTSPSGTVTSVGVTGTVVTTPSGAVSVTPAAPPPVTPFNPSSGLSYYSFTNTNGQVVNVSASQFDSWTPQQQFNFLKSVGQIGKDAIFQLNPDGTLAYSLPPVTTYQGSTLSQPILNQMIADAKADPNGYGKQFQSYLQTVLSQGTGAAQNQYQTIINQATAEVFAAGLNPVTLNIYKSAGGGQGGMDAVQSAQQAALLTLQNAGFIKLNADGSYNINIVNSKGSIADVATIATAFPSLPSDQINSFNTQYQNLINTQAQNLQSQIISSEIKPYMISGTNSFNVVAAIQGGVPDATLLAENVSQATINNIKNSLVTVKSNIAANPSKPLTPVQQEALTISNSIKAKVSSFLRNALDNIVAGFESFGTGVETTFSTQNQGNIDVAGTPNPVITGIKIALPIVEQEFQRIISNVEQGFQTLVTEVSGTFTNRNQGNIVVAGEPNPITQNAIQYANTATQYAKKVINNTTEGLKTVLAQTRDTFTNQNQGVIQVQGEPNPISKDIGEIFDALAQRLDSAGQQALSGLDISAKQVAGTFTNQNQGNIVVPPMPVAGESLELGIESGAKKLGKVIPRDAEIAALVQTDLENIPQVVTFVKTNPIVKEAVNIALDSLPIVGTVRTWKQMNNVEKAISIILDALILIPIANSIAAGAEAVEGLDEGARLMGGVEGLVDAVKSQVTAPIDMVLHPVETAKSTFVGLRDLLETALDPNQIPFAVVSTTNGTVRLPIDGTTTAEEALEARYQLMAAVRDGEQPVVEVNGIRYELDTSALMNELPGSLAHATPQGEAFAQGFTVMQKTNPLTGVIMPDSEQGLFLANQPLPRFLQSSAFGATGERPAVLIVSGDVAKEAINTEKIYQGMTEMELKLPVGVDAPPPNQILYFRLPNGEKVDVMLFGDTLNPIQIAKLKSLALVEDLRAPFSPAISRTVLDNMEPITTIDDAQTIANELRVSGNADAARAVMSSYGASDAIADYINRVQTTDTATIRRIAPDGTVRTQSLNVRASGTPERDINVVRTGNDVTFRNQVVRGEAARTDEVRATATRETPIRTTRIEPFRETTPRISAVETPRANPPRQDTQRTPLVSRTTPRIETDRTPPRVITSTQPPRVISPTRTPPRTPRGNVPTRTPPRTIPPTRISTPFGGISSTEMTPAEKRRESFKGSVGWKMGFGYWFLKYPYRGQKDIAFFKEPPTGATIVDGYQSAYKTIQLLTGRPPSRDLKIPMGIMNVTVSKPEYKAGKPGAIKFKQNTRAVKGFSSGLVTIKD